MSRPAKRHERAITAGIPHRIEDQDMKPLLLNTAESQGGAAIATRRLHLGLRAIGVDSRMLVQARNSDDAHVIGPRTKAQKAVAFFRPYVEQVPVKCYPRRNKGQFTPAWLPEHLASDVARLDPEIVHLFWVGGGFLRLESLRDFKRPIVWTLHDMWPFTGGCHYDEGCGKFRQSCGSCPVLHSERERDLSRSIWERKRNAWQGVPITMVASCHWMADLARASALFRDQRIEVIPNGLDTDRYKPIDTKVAREAYNLPQDKQLILLSAHGATSDKRKGNQYLTQALEQLAYAGREARVELVIIGASAPQPPPAGGIKVHYMGYMQDEISQVLLYSAADVLVAPSIQENLSNTVMESLACGTPVVAFDVGGMPDMIEHEKCGYLAKPFEAADLARGISWVLEDRERHALLSRNARHKVVENFALHKIARRYLELYESIVQ